MAEHRPPINKNWGIDTTAKGLISMGVELYGASRSDNVHPDVLQACHAYGSTLPIMCPETTELIKEQCRRSVTYKRERLQAFIGYHANDIASNLAADDYGLRFLVLTATLLSFGKPFKTAECLHRLLSDSLKVEGQLPSARTLQDLLLVLSHRLDCSDFGNWLRGYEIALKNTKPSVARSQMPVTSEHGEAQSRQGAAVPRTTMSADDDPHVGSEREETFSSTENPTAASLAQEEIRQMKQSTATLALRGRPSDSITVLSDLQRLGFEDSSMFGDFWNAAGIEAATDADTVSSGKIKERSPVDPWLPDTTSCLCPSASQLSALIRALRELDRLGEVRLIRIRTPSSTAVWIIAFLRWCTGKAPTVYDTRRQNFILAQHESNIIVDIYDSQTPHAFEVQTFKDVSGFDQLLWCCRGESAFGPSDFAMTKPKIYFAATLGHGSSTSKRRQDLSLLLTLAQEVKSKSPIRTDGIEWSELFPRFLPSPATIIQLIAKYFDLNEDFLNQKFEPVDLDKLVADWREDRRTEKGDIDTIFKVFYGILCSSLLENVHNGHDLELYVDGRTFDRWWDRQDDYIHEILQDTIYLFVPERARMRPIAEKHDKLEEGLMHLLGHPEVYLASEQKTTSGLRTLATAGRGQVECLSILEHFDLSGETLYSRVVLPGRLIYDGDYWSAVSGMTTRVDKREATVSRSYIRSPEQKLLSSDAPLRQDSFVLSNGDEGSLTLGWLPDLIQPTEWLDFRTALGCISNVLFVRQCLQPCASTSKHTPLKLCRTMQEAIATDQSHGIITIKVSQNPKDVFYALTVASECALSLQDEKTKAKRMGPYGAHEMENGGPVIIVYCVHACAVCAYMIVMKEFNTSRGPYVLDQPTKLVIITDKPAARTDEKGKKRSWESAHG